MDNTKLLEFAKTLSGVYDNLEQSQQNPQDFARINIYFRPLPWEVFNAPGFIQSSAMITPLGIHIVKAFTS